MGKNEKKEKKKVPKRIKISIGIIAVVLVTVIVATVLMQSSSVSLMNLSSQKAFASAEEGTVTMVEDTSTGKTIYVPVPAGYTASTATGENTVADGLVIYEGTEAVTDDNVEEAREERNQYVWIPVDDASELYETDEDGKKWGKLYEYSSNLKTASDLVDDGLEKIIGATVTGYDDYEYSDSDIGWLIFYADEENIYLIADDYIPYEYIPSNSSGSKPDQAYNTRGVLFDGINGYYGSEDIKDSRLQALNSLFYASYTSTNDNMKAVAYMMDTVAWSKYVGTAAEYAIGGPTIELLFKSYNAKYGTNYQAKATSDYGYQISEDGETWSYSLTSAYSSEYLNASDRTYVISETTNAEAMWLASPSAYAEDYLMAVNWRGGINYDGCTSASNSYAPGFRPLVCLSSDVKLQKNDDGTYTIVEDTDEQRSAITDSTSTDTTSYREPVILSDYDSDDYLMEYTVGYENGHELLADLETEFNEMIASVIKWGGFYIGRYETGELSEDTPVVKQGNDDISNQTWYEMYEKCKELGNSSDDVTTSMIFGSQWDAALQYFIDIGDKEYSEVVSSSSWGNYSGNIETTGSSDDYSACNVYDMAGNVSEWTIEAYGTDSRIARGGSYDGSTSAASRDGSTPVTSSNTIGCRAALWLDTDLEQGDMVAIAKQELTIEDLLDEGIENFIGSEVEGYDDYDYYEDAEVGWLIFYIDEDNIYLIADDYIPYECIPENSLGHKPLRGSYRRSAYFSPVLDDDDYEGSESITDERLRALNSSYYNSGYSSTAGNIQSVAYMMDLDAWDVYAGSAAEYAIGGPTIELLFKSYNAKYETNYQAKATSNYGYQISTDGGSTWEYSMSSSSDYLKTSDRVYVISEDTNAYGMWIASPSANGRLELMYVYYTGRVGARGCSDPYGVGFRPVVCLKSEVRLQKNEDGTYTIIYDED